MKSRIAAFTLMAGLSVSAMLVPASAQAQESPEAEALKKCSISSVAVRGAQVQITFCRQDGAGLVIRGLVRDTAADSKCAQGTIRGPGIAGRGTAHLATACGNGRSEAFNCTFRQVRPSSRMALAARLVPSMPATRECAVLG